MKVDNALDRIPTLEQFGFESSDFRNGGYMEWQRTSYFRPELGFAICGLACCLCTENQFCPGCKSGGCKDKDWCKAYHCLCNEDKEYCLFCQEYSECSFEISKLTKSRALQKLISVHGEDNILACLKRNEEQGINYHYVGEYVGDYDNMSEEETMELILKGWE